jgi:anion-transporting  ArsA/GET3 family ATPase
VDPRAGADAVRAVLNSNLVLVTGKGGTGKTTAAAALAVVGARLGRRTVLCEIDNQRPSVDAVFERQLDFTPTPLMPNLHGCNIDFSGALAAFVHRMVPMRRVVKLVLENRMINKFLDFTPGSRELVIMSRLGELADEYDLVVVDMPASGHAFSLLDVLRSARGLFRSGPVKALAERLSEQVRESSTRLVFVALPEEMVVNETLETLERMRTSGVVGGDPLVLLNRATLPSMTVGERQLIDRLAQAELAVLAREFVRAGRWEDRLEQATSTSISRLSVAFPGPPVLVPPAGGSGGPRENVSAVAVHIGRLVGLTRREVEWT